MPDQFGNSDSDLERGDNQVMRRKEDAGPTYSKAIRALNKAAYAAIRAGGDTTELPDIDRQSLRLIAGETDRLVDYEINSGFIKSRIRENT